MAPTAQAAVLCELGKPLVPMELELPELRPGQVMVNLAYSGVCHSQLNEVRGRRGPDRYLPHTLGHEGSGTVLEVGAGVRKVKPGDHVVVSWIQGEGADVPGCVYRSARGKVNSGAVSTFMTTAVTCENRVVAIPEGMPLREAALLGCAVPTGAGMVFHMTELRAGQSVAVFGAGGIGLSAIMAAHQLGARMIVAVDIVGWKLEEARRLGATHTVHAGESDPNESILDLTEKQGVDYAIESAGRRVTMEAAFRAVRERGGLCVLCGNLPHGEHMAIDPFDLIRGKRIVGSWGGAARMDHDVRVYCALFASGAFPLTQLVSREYPLSDVNQALDDLEAGRVARALIGLKG